MMACRHLPLPFLSGPCQRKKMLVEAATSLEKIGDKRALQECQQLLLQLNSVAAIEQQTVFLSSQFLSEVRAFQSVLLLEVSEVRYAFSCYEKSRIKQRHTHCCSLFQFSETYSTCNLRKFGHQQWTDLSLFPRAFPPFSRVSSPLACIIHLALAPAVRAREYGENLSNQKWKLVG